MSGDVEIDSHVLNTRDGLGILDIEAFHIKANSQASILLMEVPMNIN